MKSQNPTKELWLLSFSAARMLSKIDPYWSDTNGGAGYTSRCAKSMKAAVDYALTGSGDRLAFQPGRIFYLQACRRQKNVNSPVSPTAMNCRCVVKPIIKITGL